MSILLLDSSNMKFITSQILSVIILILPICSSYQLFGFELDILLLIVSIVILFIYYGCPKLSFPKYYLFFLIYILFIPAIVSSFCGFNNNLFTAFFPKGIVLYSLMLGLALPHLDKIFFLSLYKKICIFSIAIFLLQEFFRLFIGYSFSALIPFLPVVYDGMDMVDMINKQMQLDRSSSIFLEPSHFAQYLLPYLCVSLGQSLERNKWFNKESIILTMILLLLKSGNGLLVSMIIWILFFLKIKIDVIKKSLLYVAFIPMIIILFSMCEDIGAENSLFLRVKELNFTPETTWLSSGFVRLFRGYYVFAEYPDILKFFGIGTENLHPFIDNSNAINWMFDDEYYINGIQAILLYGGVIGLCLFSLHIINLYKKGNSISKLVVIALILLCLMETIYATTKMLLYLVFILNTQRIDFKQIKK